MFEPGTLWQRVQMVTRSALTSGALQPIETRFESIEDQGIEFQIRVVAHLARKETASASETARSRQNPFLPYDPQLYVADATEAHVCVLNKFNVVEHHLLIVTREFEDQTLPLIVYDFTALTRCMAEYESLAFYNSGSVAGASQLHKHLQLVPWPMRDSAPAVPIESLMASVDDRNQIVTNPALPFRHLMVRFEPLLIEIPAQHAEHLLHSFYLDMLAESDSEQTQRAQYNLLVTPRWMLFVPRTRESYEDISLNALAFAGSLLVKNDDQLNTLATAGPAAALRFVTT
jgi:ATP adenylyltransferase